MSYFYSWDLVTDICTYRLRGCLERSVSRASLPEELFPLPRLPFGRLRAVSRVDQTSRAAVQETPPCRSKAEGR